MHCFFYSREVSGPAYVRASRLIFMGPEFNDQVSFQRPHSQIFRF
jgi:hypothetical protein